MNRKLTLAALGAAAALGALALPALAQEGPSPNRTENRGPGRGPAGPGAMFRAADANGDGRVTTEEAWSALSARFAEADANHDGGVTWEEARGYAQAQMRAHAPHRAERASARMEARGEGFFRALDADRDGRVTLAELRPAAEAMFRARDANGDGALTGDEVGPRQRR